MAQLGSAFDSKPLQLVDFLEQIHSGDLQVPNFQRDWVWSDYLIRSLIASVSMPYPVGSILLLEAGNGRQQFSSRSIFGAPVMNNKRADFLVLDGQQRLTAMYLALKAEHPEKLDRKSRKGRNVYYLSIKDCLNKQVSREDAVISKPLTNECWDGNRNDNLDDDLSCEEYRTRMFPLHLCLDDRRVKWIEGYKNFHKQKGAELNRISKFSTHILDSIKKYEFPTIIISSRADRETVCRMFETINSRGVTLTVFDLLTAKFAVKSYDLRKDWKKRQEKLNEFNALRCVRDIDFIKTVTLLATYARSSESESRKVAKCQREDILGLKLSEYKSNCDQAEQGYLDAQAFLGAQGILLRKDVPYRTQLVPLAALLAQLHGRTTTPLQRKLEQWFWCGVLGELYSGATESRAGIDMGEVMEWATRSTSIPSG